MRGVRKQLTLALIAMAAYGIVIGAGQQLPAGGRYTPSQATAGRTAYQTNCASCHGADLSGQASTPPITGSGFLSTWGRRTVADLFSFLKSSMPPSTVGSLSDLEYLNIVAFMLQTNGAPAGDQPLTATSTGAINVGGPAVAAAQAGGAGAASAEAGGGADAAPARPGLTGTG